MATLIFDLLICKWVTGLKQTLLKFCFMYLFIFELSRDMNGHWRNRRRRQTRPSIYNGL